MYDYVAFVWFYFLREFSQTIISNNNRTMVYSRFSGGRGRELVLKNVDDIYENNNKLRSLKCIVS